MGMFAKLRDIKAARSLFMCMCRSVHCSSSKQQQQQHQQQQQKQQALQHVPSGGMSGMAGMEPGGVVVARDLGLRGIQRREGKRQQVIRFISEVVVDIDTECAVHRKV